MIPLNNIVWYILRADEPIHFCKVERVHLLECSAPNSGIGINLVMQAN